MLLRYTVMYISFYYAINAIHGKKEKKVTWKRHWSFFARILSIFWTFSFNPMQCVISNNGKSPVKN